MQRFSLILSSCLLLALTACAGAPQQDPPMSGSGSSAPSMTPAPAASTTPPPAAGTH